MHNNMVIYKVSLVHVITIPEGDSIRHASHQTFKKAKKWWEKKKKYVVSCLVWIFLSIKIRLPLRLLCVCVVL